MFSFIDILVISVLYVCFFMYALVLYQHNFVFCDMSLFCSKKQKQNNTKRLLQLWESELTSLTYEKKYIVDPRTKCRIFVWILYSTTPSKDVFLYCHGNSGNVCSNLRKIIRLMEEVHCNVIVFDYAGYGLSSGKCYTEKDMFSNTLAVYESCVLNNEQFSRCFIYGSSLGGIPALMLAVYINKRCSGIILENTLYSFKFVFKSCPFLYYAVQHIPLFSSMCVRDILHQHGDVYDFPITLLCSKYDQVISSKNTLKIYDEMHKYGIENITYIQFIDPDINHTNAWKLHRPYFQYFIDLTLKNT